MQALSPPPDGCYPNFTTAEGCKALAEPYYRRCKYRNWLVFALRTTTTGSYNTAVGAGALDLNNADNNTAVGVAALLLNTTGTNNTANGAGALVFNDSGEGNTATGAFALYSNTEGRASTRPTASSRFISTSPASAIQLIGDSALYFNTEWQPEYWRSAILRSCPIPPWRSATVILNSVCLTNSLRLVTFGKYEGGIHRCASRPARTNHRR